MGGFLTEIVSFHFTWKKKREREQKKKVTLILTLNLTYFKKSYAGKQGFILFCDPKLKFRTFIGEEMWTGKAPHAG